MPQRRSALLKTGLVSSEELCPDAPGTKSQTRNLDWWSPLAGSFLNTAEEVNFPKRKLAWRFSLEPLESSPIDLTIFCDDEDWGCILAMLCLARACRPTALSLAAVARRLKAEPLARHD